MRLAERQCTGKDEQQLVALRPDRDAFDDRRLTLSGDPVDVFGVTAVSSMTTPQLPRAVARPRRGGVDVVNQAAASRCKNRDMVQQSNRPPLIATPAITIELPSAVTSPDGAREPAGSQLAGTGAGSSARRALRRNRPASRVGAEPGRHSIRATQRTHRSSSSLGTATASSRQWPGTARTNRRSSALSIRAITRRGRGTPPAGANRSARHTGVDGDRRLPVRRGAFCGRPRGCAVDAARTAVRNGVPG